MTREIVTSPRVAALWRGGNLYVGLESGDAETPSLQYPVLVQFVSVPIPGPLAGQVGLQTLTMPISLPVPSLVLAREERLQPLGGDDLRYAPLRDFLPQYLGLVERIKKSTATPPQAPLFTARRG